MKLYVSSTYNKVSCDYDYFVMLDICMGGDKHITQSKRISSHVYYRFMEHNSEPSTICEKMIRDMYDSLFLDVMDCLRVEELQEGEISVDGFDITDELKLKGE